MLATGQIFTGPPYTAIWWTSRVFTHAKKLRAYKSLDAYNYVVCGHVQMVLYSDIGDDFCVKSGGFTEPDMK